MPVNSKSEIEIGPLGLVGETSNALMSSGHGMNQTNGAKGCVPAYHAPPTPHLLASTKPLYAFVVCCMSSLT